MWCGRTVRRASPGLQGRSGSFRSRRRGIRAGREVGGLDDLRGREVGRTGRRCQRSVQRAVEGQIGRDVVAWSQRQVHVVGELALEGTAATNSDAAALTAGHRSAVRQRHGGVAAVPADVQGAGRGAGQEAAGAQGGLFVAGVEPVAVDGRPVAALATQEASPEQSVPRAVSPPEMYGVPETWLTKASSDAVAIANMTMNASNGNLRASKFCVCHHVSRIVWCALHARLFTSCWGRGDFVNSQVNAQNILPYTAFPQMQGRDG